MRYRASFVTNSSSSSFVVNTGETPEQVKDKLQKMLELYNYLMNTNYPFESIFDNPFILEELNTGEYAWRWESTKENLGKTIILSASENTIPYGLYDLLEEAFDTYREHLG